MSSTLNDKIAIVTGAGRGIGRGIALELAVRGARVLVVDMDADAAARTAADCGNGSVGYTLNVSDAAAVNDFVARVIEEHSRIDILVNNAGINRDAMLHKMTDEQWDAVIAVDLSGVFYLCRAVGTHMRGNGYGRIVNIASASWMGNIGQTNYAAAKGGVVSLTRSIAKELAFKNVTANAICPGFIETEMTRSMPQDAFDQMLARIPLRRIGQPEDVARVVAFLSSDDSAYVTGEVINVGGGFKL
ncbi:3-oxoacyl-ACP reductase FabG [Schaalia vaccimaxillae]|uniref:3-oxoacyl-ACP reductase FabG n=1 Tax=Schaalia vaccimaxillae TaxID=183916 RepID=UPI0003B3B41B|nr:3-oxoacyl-ACP reductase FabG [Schaalia vaccimaxillae]